MQVMLNERPYAELFITMFPITSLRTYRVMLLLSLTRTQKLLPNTPTTRGVLSQVQLPTPFLLLRRRDWALLSAESVLWRGCG